MEARLLRGHLSEHGLKIIPHRKLDTKRILKWRRICCKKEGNEFKSFYFVKLINIEKCNIVVHTPYMYISSDDFHTMGLIDVNDA